MNEWSPTGNYSGPGGFYQTGRPLRSQWNESEKGTKLLAVNIRTLAESRNRSFQQHSMESISKTSLSTSNKLGGGNGTSDPRFKRVITPGVQNDVCVGTEAKIPKGLTVPGEKEAPLTKLSAWNAPEFKTKKSWVESIKNSEQTKIKLQDINEPPYEKLNADEDFNFDQTQDNFKAVDKLSFNHDIVNKSDSKESLSACTINTKNSSLASEEVGDKLPNELAKVPSATRDKKVQHWIHDQISKPEKKHSVITVIGQIQDPNSLSSAFQEIDRRRKLVKELDKYAVCKKIIESDKKEDVSGVMVKMNTLNNDVGVITSGSVETLNNCSCPNSKVSQNKSNKYSSLSTKEKNFKCCNDPAITLYGEKKYFSIRKKINDFKSSLACLLKGLTFSTLSYQRMFCIMILTTGILCWFTIFSIQKGSFFVPFDFFNSKPKPITWYEKVCHWLWEFFRPSGNYKRTKPWRSF